MMAYGVEYSWNTYGILSITVPLLPKSQHHRQQKRVRSVLTLCGEVVELLLDHTIPDAEVRATVFQHWSRDQLADLPAECRTLASPTLKELDNGGHVPLIGEVTWPNGAPELWALEALNMSGEAADPLELPLQPVQYPAGQAADKTLLDLSLEESITRQIFGRAEPPRTVYPASDGHAAAS
jgi:hypothetical protein